MAERLDRSSAAAWLALSIALVSILVHPVVAVLAGAGAIAVAWAARARVALALAVSLTALYLAVTVLFMLGSAGA